jgi:methionyl-tRNA formyltransferase
MAGEPVTGITIMKMVQALDAGDMLDACSMSIPVDMNHAELESQLAKISKEPLLRVLERLEKGGLKTIKQDDSQATFAPKITSSEIEIDWNRPAWDVHNQIRALSPYPGAWTWIEWGGERKKMKIKKTVLEKGHTALPKQNIILDKTNWVVSCLQDHLRILEVQIEGKKVLPIDQFLRGLQTPLSVL